MHAITQPSFAHHVGQSAVLSCHIGALYGELLLHSSCMPFQTKSISFERPHDPTIFLHQFHSPTQGCTSICLPGSRSTRTDLYCDGVIAILLKPLLPNRYITEKYHSSLLLHDSYFTIDILPCLDRSAAKYDRHAIC